MTPHKLIVVGVDGSDAATAALRWACGDATTYGATIEVVHAFRPVAGPLSAVEDAAARSLRLLSREVWVALATVKNPPPIRLTNQPGDPAPVLVSRSAQARLLVLGRRDYANTDSPGSIAAICQQNARCRSPSSADPDSSPVARTLSNASHNNGHFPDMPSLLQLTGSSGAGVRGDRAPTGSLPTQRSRYRRSAVTSAQNDQSFLWWTASVA